MALYLGLDVGTQGVKALVYDGSSRKVVGRGAQPWSILDTTVPGRAEQHPSTWIEVSWWGGVLRAHIHSPSFKRCTRLFGDCQLQPLKACRAPSRQQSRRCLRWTPPVCVAWA